MSKSQTKVILDNLGRTILGEVIKQTDSVLSLKNPVILNVVPQADGKMSLQLFPMFFREFLADKSEDVTFHYNKSQITPSSIEAIDFRLEAQYSQMFKAAPVQPQQEKSPAVVNLFDE